MGVFINLLLEKFRKLYKHELAVAKQTHTFENESEEFEALALIDMDRKVGDALTAYLDAIDGTDSTPAIASIYAYLEGVQLGILESLGSVDPSAVEFTKEFTKNWIKKLEESRRE